MEYENTDTAIEAAFIADRYALGSHWIYDGKELGALTIDWDQLNDPQAHWHKGKKRGDLTHYGDHCRWLESFLEGKVEFDIIGYKNYWLAMMQNYKGYIDSSSKDTLAVLANNPDSITGASSTELSIIGRIAPLLKVSRSREEFLANVASFVGLTHNSERVLRAAELFASLLLDVLEGKCIDDALAEIDVDPLLTDAFRSAISSKGQDSFRTIRQFGPACGIEGGFEGSLHLLASYDDFKEAMMANAMAGGDCAARGMVVGMIMGASGRKAPDAWKRA